jgi:hypothetical protein
MTKLAERIILLTCIWKVAGLTLGQDTDYVGSEIFTVVAMKNSVFWDIITCNPVIVN